MSERACWCGHPTLSPYSADYHVCKACGTLVSRAPLDAGRGSVKDEGELYSKDYWTTRQTSHHGLPELAERARLDLPERCVHWLRHVLPRVPEGGRLLEIGCGHGGFLSLAQAAGLNVVGTEMSPWVVEQGKTWFQLDLRAGPIEQQSFSPGEFDAIALHDVIEHLPDPVATLRHCRQLLKPDGVFFIQTPEYVEHRSYEDLIASQDLFLRHMDRNNDEHLYLYSRRSAARFFSDLGFPVLEHFRPVYAYDHYFLAANKARPVRSEAEVSAQLANTPTGRLLLALLDKARESEDRWWAIQRLEAGGQR